MKKATAITIIVLLVLLAFLDSCKSIRALHEEQCRRYNVLAARARTQPIKLYNSQGKFIGFIGQNAQVPIGWYFMKKAGHKKQKIVVLF